MLVQKRRERRAVKMIEEAKDVDETDDTVADTFITAD